MNSEEILEQIRALQDLKVLVIGETIIDEYIFCKAMGRPEKAAVVSVQYLRREKYAGGCLAVANHIAGFVKDVKVITVVGEDNEHKIDLCSNVIPVLFENPEAPTIVKTRYLEDWNKSKLFEVSEIDDRDLPKKVESKIVSLLKECLKDFDLVVVTDFGHGFFTKKIRDTLIKHGKFISVNAQTNSANHGFNLITKYRGVDFISIDEQELRLPYSAKYGDPSDLIHRLSRDTSCSQIIITRGSNGLLFYHNKNLSKIPVFHSKIVDTVGAGDAVLSITSLLACKNINPTLIPIVGNLVGSIAVGYMGNKKSINYEILEKSLMEVESDS